MGRVTNHLGPHNPCSQPLQGLPTVPAFESHILSVLSKVAPTWPPSSTLRGSPSLPVWDGILYSPAPGSASITSTVTLAARCLLPGSG